MKLTEERLDELIEDEEMASKEYHALGFHNLARDESKHARFLKKIKRKR